MSETLFPKLVADIGGTNARFAIVESPNKLPTDLMTFQVADHPDPNDPIRLALESCRNRPNSFLFAIAGPPHQTPIQLTNGDWKFDAVSMIAEFGVQEIGFVNDFVAQAAAVCALAQDDIFILGDATPNLDGPVVVVGPGTGLGVASIFPIGGRFLIVPGEGGNVDLGPRGTSEQKLWKNLPMFGGRISAEMLISGQGLETIFRTLSVIEGKNQTDISAARISHEAANGDAKALEACRLMLELLARFCGDLSLLLMAHGGVYVTGGVVRAILPFLDSAEFRKTFEDKTPYFELMRKQPLAIVTHENPGILGLTSLAQQEDRYDLRFALRKFSS